MKKYLLGIDVGTTGTKTLLFSADGQLLGHAYRGYEMNNPQVGYSEQNAEDWWNAVCETVREVCSDPEIGKAVAAISLSLQGGTMVAVDKDMKPVRPAMVWNDGRGGPQMEEYLREVGEAETMYQKTGWRLGRSMLVIESRWMRDNEPELFEKTAMFLSVPDYISMKMTGIPAVDMSDAGNNQFANIRTGCYDPELLKFSGVTEEQLPKLVHSGDVIGNLTAEAADAMGLSTDCVLVAGAHDQYAVALGAGALHNGDILIGSGTCWVVTAIGDEPAFETGLAQSIAAVPGKWGSLLSLSSGGVCLEWWRRNLTAAPDGSQIPFDVINEEVAKRKAAEDGLFFYPFSGNAAPDRKFQKASFIGLDLSHDRFDIARAIMEGVAFQALWMMESFKTKPSKEGLKLAGGASKSALWCQMVADIANLPVRIPEVADLACVGAAILAGTGCGIYPNVEEGYKCLAVRERVIQPDPARAEMYAKLYEQYKKCAGVLGEVYGL